MIVIFTFSTGFATQVKAEVVSSIIQLGVEQTSEERPCLNLDSSIDFSGKIALCLKLHQPENHLKHTIIKHLTIPKSNTPFKSTSTRSYSYKIPGVTHFLNNKNNEMCNTISKDD